MENNGMTTETNTMIEKDMVVEYKVELSRRGVFRPANLRVVGNDHYIRIYHKRYTGGTDTLQSIPTKMVPKLIEALMEFI